VGNSLIYLLNGLNNLPEENAFIHSHPTLKYYTVLHQADLPGF
jgi:hypothetical protein